MEGKQHKGNSPKSALAKMGSSLYPSMTSKASDASPSARPLQMGYSMAAGGLNINTDDADLEQEDGGMTAMVSVKGQQNFEDFLSMAGEGELDIYTCLALSDCFTWSGPNVRSMWCKMIAVVSLQILVPIFMLRRECRSLNVFPVAEEVEFRLTGFILYFYSLYHMYNNALDECRYVFIDYAFRTGLSFGYILPALVGEFANTLVSFVLVLTLYQIYCDTTQTAELILNALAVNFLGAVDTEFMSQDMFQTAQKDFEKLMNVRKKERLEKGTVHEQHRCVLVIESIIKYFLSFVRVVGTLGAGTVLGMNLLFGYARNWCHTDGLLLGTIACADYQHGHIAP